MRDRTDSIIFNPTYNKVVFIQLFSVFSILFLLNILAKFRTEPKLLPFPKGKDTNANIVLIQLVVILIFLLLGNIYSISTVGFPFLERVQYAVSGSNKENALGAFFSALTSYILIPFAIACIFSRIRTLRKNKWIMRLSVAIVTIYICFMIIYGMRSFIFMPIILIFIYWRVYTLKLGRLAKYSVVALVIMLLLVAPFLSRSLLTIRTMKSYNVHDILEISPSDLFSTVGEYSQGALGDIYTKFSSFEHGTTLLQSEGTSHVGMSLIRSALTSPIPRILYPKKPVPFSSDGEYSGVPYYLVPSLRGIDLPGNVVPVPPSTIALWELGNIGLFLMIVFNVVNLLFMNYFLKSELLLYRTAGFFMLTMPTFEFLLAPTGWIIKEALRIFVLIFFIKLLLLIGSSNRKIIGFQNLTTN